MSDKIFVRIEYNELEGDIHFEQDFTSEQGDNDYKTIADEVDSDLAFEFGRQMDEKYPELGNRNKNHPSFDEMKREFQTFIVDKSSNL